MRLSELRPANGTPDDPVSPADRYRADGCLLVRGLLDPRSAASLAEQATSVLRGWGVAAAVDGGGSPRWTGRPVGVRDATELDVVPAMAGLVDGFDRPDAPLRSAVDRLCGQPMFLWRNACFFASIPDDPAYVTKPHQDGYAMSSTGDYRRVWIALTHIPFGDGGLGVALGSHRSGRLPQRAFPDHRVRPTPDDPHPDAVVRGVGPELVDDHWHTAELHPGDGLVFHTDLVHRGLPATSDRIRLALAVIASGADDPRPASTYTKAEMRERAAALRRIGRVLGLSRERRAAAGTDLVMTGLPVTEDTVRAAAAGRHAGWRTRSPAQVADRERAPVADPS